MEMLVIAVIAMAAFAAVLLPLLRRGSGRVADDEREFAAAALPDDAVVENALQPMASGAATPVTAASDGGDGRGDRIEREVLRYREALRAGTLCVRCGQANPPGSAYCSDCGKRLPLADAKEFA